MLRWHHATPILAAIACGKYPFETIVHGAGSILFVNIILGHLAFKTGGSRIINKDLPDKVAKLQETNYCQKNNSLYVLVLQCTIGTLRV